MLSDFTSRKHTILSLMVYCFRKLSQGSTARKWNWRRRQALCFLWGKIWNFCITQNLPVAVCSYTLPPPPSFSPEVSKFLYQYICRNKVLITCLTQTGDFHSTSYFWGRTVGVERVRNLIVIMWRCMHALCLVQPSGPGQPFQVAVL